ncbi:MAG: 50S ribosomal protein L6 [Minisyncoccia bacterium]
MSKIGKRPIIIPEDVNVDIKDGKIFIKGPLGEIDFDIPYKMKVIKEDNVLKVEPEVLNKLTKKLWGTTRALLNNKIIGVKDGFEKTLILEGLGYAAELSKNELIFKLGFSHPVKIKIPEGINVEIKQEKGRFYIKFKGIDKEKVGKFAADIRKIKPRDVYKLKGFRYIDEVVKTKPVKKLATK